MAYYLGYKFNSDYIPIDLSDKCTTDLLDIVKYTCRYPNSETLKDDLFNDSLIPSPSVELAYLIEKGKKGNKCFVRVPNINQVYYHLANLSFNIESIQEYLKKNSSDKELFIIIYSSYLKKIGALDDIKEYLESILHQSVLLRKILEDLLEILKGNPLSITIENLLRNNTLDSNHIDILIKALGNNNKAICLAFNYLKKNLKTPLTNTLEYLRSINILHNREPIDGYGIINLINAYINSIMYTSSKNVYENEDKKIQTRNIVDLGVIIQTYKEYCLAVEQEKYSQDSREPNQDDDDFLEEEDYRRLETTSEENGMYLRVTDSSRWSSGGNNGY